MTPGVIAKIHKMGFSTQKIVVAETGYVVEGDILIPFDQLDAVADVQKLRVGDEEQYRTTNLVTGLPRTITIKFKDGWTSPTQFQEYKDALDAVVARFNALGLSLTFQRKTTTGPADIFLVRDVSGPFLASAGFPTASGAPYNEVRVNTTIIGNTYNKVTILAHEIGHCIGFRHTDYMNRQYSCGGPPVNEGDAGIGAIHIPGTPTGPDPNSWMLACIGMGVDRPFNANDITALNFLY